MQKRKQEKREDMKCNLCGFEAKSWKQLQVHMMDHSALRPYKCETCGKGFKEQQKLRRHRVTHTGEKNHKCSFCGKMMKSQRSRMVLPMVQRQPSLMIQKDEG